MPNLRPLGAIKTKGLLSRQLHWVWKKVSLIAKISFTITPGRWISLKTEGHLWKHAAALKSFAAKLSRTVQPF